MNPGEPARPLTQIASGGEASRLLLGLKAALADKLGFGVILLDEVEAGIGGRTAEAVAAVLRDLAQARRVVAITHLPLVAAHGKTHLVARKLIENKRTTISIEQVRGASRRDELVRMLGGAGTAEEQALAEQMLSKAQHN